MMRWIFLFTLAFAVSACDDVGPDGELVGASCAGNRDCDEMCETGKDFPGGMCTVACRNSGDCPSDTVCIDKEGGVCMLLCRDDFDCRGGYACKSKDLRGEGGSEAVCIGD